MSRHSLKPGDLVWPTANAPYSTTRQSNAFIGIVLRPSDPVEGRPRIRIVSISSGREYPSGIAYSPLARDFESAVSLVLRVQQRIRSEALMGNLPREISDLFPNLSSNFIDSYNVDVRYMQRLTRDSYGPDSPLDRHHRERLRPLIEGITPHLPPVAVISPLPDILP